MAWVRFLPLEVSHTVGVRGEVTEKKIRFVGTRDGWLGEGELEEGTKFKSRLFPFLLAIHRGKIKSL